MTTKAPELPVRLRDAMESIVRIANDEKFVIIGLVLRHDPPSMAIMRNTKDDPAELFHAAGSLVESKQQHNQIVECTILPLN